MEQNPAFERLENRWDSLLLQKIAGTAFFRMNLQKPAGTAFFSDPSEKGLVEEPLRRNGSEK